MLNMKQILLFVCLFFCLNNIQLSFGFSECSNSNLADPQIAGVSDCISWAAYLQSNGTDVLQWCSDSQVAAKCCWTCQIYRNYTTCNDIAYTPSCQEKAKNNECNNQLTATMTIADFCARTCGKCSNTDGPLCKNLGNVCGTQGTCTSVTYFGITTSKCVCNTGYSGASCSIVTVDPCASVTCLNGGTCSSGTCRCLSGYSGANCQIQTLNSDLTCSSVNPCENGGTCSSSGNCQCTSEYTGLFCQKFIGGCISNFCYNGGTCQANGTCTCTDQFTGVYCLSVKNGCFATSCLNGGTCRSDGTCACPSTYIGNYCETFIGGCYSQDTSKRCQNGGYCRTDGGCTCNGIYQGTFCETFLGCNAANFGCQNGGTCGSDGYCKCPTNYLGTYCEYYIGTCLTVQCLNGGQCSNGKCQCTSSYTGTYCETLISVPTVPTTIASTTTTTTTTTTTSTSTTKTTTIALATTTTSATSVQSVCGNPAIKPNETAQALKIIGGIEAIPNSFPWQVILTDNTYICGGSLLDNNWIVTAAHCLESFDKTKLIAGLGFHDYTNGGSTGIIRNISLAIAHPNYVGQTNYWQNDIALVRLSQPIVFSNVVQPICLLAQGESVATGTTGIVTGWGKTSSSNANGVTKLRQATISVLANACGSITDNEICAGKTNSPIRDSCAGDSGGPFVIKKSDGLYYLAGVVSYGTSTCNGAGVYTKVSSYITWINIISGGAAVGK